MGYRAPAPQAGRVADNDGGGRVRVGGMRAGGKVVPCPHMYYLDLERLNWALIENYSW